LIIIDLATCLFDNQSPQVDRGLRKAIITQIQQRLLTIIDDEAAWQEYSGNKAVLRAFHAHIARVHISVKVGTAPALPSLPPTPAGVKRKRSLEPSGSTL
jgi:histone acetyltransferase HTATIP